MKPIIKAIDLWALMAQLLLALLKSREKPSTCLFTITGFCIQDSIRASMCEHSIILRRLVFGPKNSFNIRAL